MARALRNKAAPAPELPPAPDPRADELREKLAEAREVVAEREETEAAETPVNEVEAPGDDVEAPGDDVAERRRKVHAHGHAVAGEMRRRSSKKAKPEEE